MACLGLLAVGLAVQLAFVIASLSRPTGLHARISAQQFADTIARDLSASLEADPAADVREVLARYLDTPLPAYFVTAEGRVIGVESDGVTADQARRIAGLAAPTDEDDPAQPVGVAPVDVLGGLEGRIIVLPRRPGWAVLQDLGAWALGGAALTAIAVAALLAWLTFAPAHRRLKALESAAIRLGEGDLAARAPEDGADEISRVARAFNQTADTLAAQFQRVTSEQAVRRQLLADVSHELHTPLTAIRGYVETLRMPGLPITDADRARYLGVVDDEAVRLEQLVGDLLDLARVEAGGSGLRLAPVAVSALWARLRDRHALAASAADVRLIFEDSPLEVQADAGRIEQALSNLIANALRFTPEGGDVRVSAQVLDGAVRLDVADSGVGLSGEDQARVFDRFFKQDASRSRGGTGLGLAIVRAIAEAHGGQATVRSTSGEGSTFSVVLPHRGGSGAAPSTSDAV